LDAAFAHMLASTPRSRLRRPSVGVAIGLAHGQLRQIEALPPVQQLSMLTRLVREHADSFFLRIGRRLVVTDVERHANGEMWTTAFDGALVDDVLASLRKRRFRRTTVVLSAVARSAFSEQGSHTFVEDGIGCKVVTDARGDVRVRRVADAIGDVRVPAMLAPVGADASDFIAAYCAAFASPRSSFAWRPIPSGADARTMARLRAGAAAVALVVSVFAALAAPGIRMMLATRNVSHELDRLRSLEIEMGRTDGDLQRVSAELDRIDAFRAARGRIALLLGALSQSLPDSTALVSLRIDTLDASFVALAPHAAEILSELGSIDDVVAPRIVGSIGRETIGGVRVERATVRFRREAGTARGARPTTARRQ
jgi:hypothetical protein